jgi:hypothetical protein
VKRTEKGFQNVRNFLLSGLNAAVGSQHLTSHTHPPSPSPPSNISSTALPQHETKGTERHIGFVSSFIPASNITIQFNSIQLNSIQFNSIQFNSIQFKTMSVPAFAKNTTVGAPGVARAALFVFF